MGFWLEREKIDFIVDICWRREMWERENGVRG